MLILTGCDDGFEPAAVQLVDDSVVIQYVLCPGVLVEEVAVFESTGDSLLGDDPVVWIVRAEEGSRTERFVLGIEPDGFETLHAFDGSVPPAIYLNIDTTHGKGISGGGIVSDYPPDGLVVIGFGQRERVVTFDQWRTNKLERCPTFDGPTLDELPPQIIIAVGVVAVVGGIIGLILGVRSTMKYRRLRTENPHDDNATPTT